MRQCSPKSTLGFNPVFLNSNNPRRFCRYFCYDRGEKTQMKDFSHPPRENITLTGVLHALSDPVRLSVVQALSKCKNERACGTFCVPVAKSTMSHHMRVLREAGIIRTRTEGTQSLTSLRRDDLEARVPGVLEAVLRATQTDPEKA